MLAGFQNTEQSIIKLSSKNSKYILSLAVVCRSSWAAFCHPLLWSVVVLEPMFFPLFSLLSISLLDFGSCSSRAPCYYFPYLFTSTMCPASTRCLFLGFFSTNIAQVGTGDENFSDNDVTGRQGGRAVKWRVKDRYIRGAITVLHHESLFGV